jgi:hypothetical protein
MTVRHGSRSIRGATALALAALVALGACGGGGDDDDGAGAADPTSTTEGAAALEAELEDRLLTPEDLTTGNPLDAAWAVGDVSQGVDIDLPDCLVEGPVEGALASAGTKLVTVTDLKLPSVEHALSAFEGDGAVGAFEAAEARLDGCQAGFAYQGTPAVGQIERLPLTLGGERAAAWRTTVTIAGAGVAITTVHVQEGDHELSLVHVDLGVPDPVLLEGYVAKALVKLA